MPVLGSREASEDELALKPEYETFVSQKFDISVSQGIQPAPIPSILFPHQRAITAWALRRGRAAIFADTGLGKTAMLAEWARQVSTRGRVLILAPLAVANQIGAEAAKFGVEVDVVREESGAPIVCTNYERLDHFEVERFVGVVIDESSVLKAYNGRTRNKIIGAFKATPYRLACTATPAPNDYTELGNHAEFLGARTRTEMLSEFFILDDGIEGKSSQSWRLKGHARQAFWRWVCTWAAFLRKPSDLGFNDEGYELPALRMHEHVIPVRFEPRDTLDAAAAGAQGKLFLPEARTLSDQRRVRRDSIDERVRIASELAAGNEPVLVWCEYNEEADRLERAIPGAIQVRGNHDPEIKAERLLGFAAGRYRVMVTKPSIAGFGMNWQHCARVIFLGASHSYEQTYQAIRRCWRFGQTRGVDVHVIYSENETAVIENYQRKEADAKAMAEEMVRYMAEMQKEAMGIKDQVFQSYEVGEVLRPPLGIQPRSEAGVMGQHHSDRAALYWADCVDVVRAMADQSVHLSVFSPPFASLFTYSASERDMGNCRTYEQFFEHLAFLRDELMRVMLPGRIVAMHCMLLPTTQATHGKIGLRDFRGDLIRCFESGGWIYHSEVVIWKDPVQAMLRSKALGLLYKQLRKDSCMSRQASPDYVVVLRKPGRNPEPVEHREQDFPLSTWQKWAEPVWTDIDQYDTLQLVGCRDERDEKHICVAEGSLVLTREHGYQPIELVEPGEHVLTHHGRWRPVLARRCNGTESTVRVCAQGVANLIATHDHRLYTRQSAGGRAKESARKSDPTWVQASETIGSYLNLRLPPVEKNELSAEEWWIIGRWLGDGHRGTRRTSGARGAGFGEFIVSCSHDEAPGLIRRLGHHAGQVNKRTATQITLVGLRHAVRETLDRCGAGAANKRLPGEAVALCQKKADALLSGYLSADEHYVSRYDRHCASSKSRALVLGMVLVAMRARGVVASAYAGRPEREGVICGRDVHMSQEWIFAFRASEGYRKSGWIDELGSWRKVRKIEDAGERRVWDLQVEEDESFTAEGCVVHNCPLQLEAARRCVLLWSNPGDVVLSPFAGIGTEGYVALEQNRRFIGVELKESYYRRAVVNISTVTSQGTLF